MTGRSFLVRLAVMSGVAVLSYRASWALLGCSAATTAAIVDDPRVTADMATQAACRAVGRAVALDAGPDAGAAVVAAAFGAYCACTVDAGLRGTCAGIGP